MDDAIVLGAGPNGLTAAAWLARQGWKVRVLEAKARPGGALYSIENTLPGFVHDVGAAFFPFASASPAFAALDLEGTGLRFRHADYDSAHPAPDGSCACIARDVERAAATFGADADAYRRLAYWQRDMGERLPRALLAPLPALAEAWKLGPAHLTRLALLGPSSSAAFSRRTFQTEAARRIIPGLGLHADLGPHDFSGAGLGLVLALLASWSGFPAPVGGARTITDALLSRLRDAGGVVQLNTHVDRILTRRRRVVGVRTSDGSEIPVRRAVIADVGPQALYLRMLPSDCVGRWLRKSVQRFEYAWGTFKMDWALSGPVPWKSERARAAAVVHAGDSIDDLDHFTREVRAGLLPTNPYLVIGQQSLIDDTRAPAGCETLWAYSHVPSNLSSQLQGGWQRQRDAFADRIEERIEGLAPGFRKLILGRAIFSPPDLEAMNENLVGGDLGGGSAKFTQQLFFRPAFPYFRYRTPVQGVYLASASTHPGAGVHGACGFNAAQFAYRDHS